MGEPVFPHIVGLVPPPGEVCRPGALTGREGYDNVFTNNHQVPTPMAATDEATINPRYQRK